MTLWGESPCFAAPGFARQDPGVFPLGALNCLADIGTTCQLRRPFGEPLEGHDEVQPKRENEMMKTALTRLFHGWRPRTDGGAGAYRDHLGYFGFDQQHASIN